MALGFWAAISLSDPYCWMYASQHAHEVIEKIYSNPWARRYTGNDILRDLSWRLVKVDIEVSTFEDLVRQMRSAQREYFKTRTASALKLAKSLERQVDRYLAEGVMQQDLPL